MSLRRHKPVLGLIGAIGAGKSTVAAALGRRGAAVVDADKLGHEVLELPEIRAALTNRWGVGILKADSSINRRAVAAIVFADPMERKFLESHMYPAIGRRAADAVAAAQNSPASTFVVLDAAVLIEAKWKEVCDSIVYVDAHPEIRLERVRSRSGWTEADLASRESAQLPAETKKAIANIVVYNNGSEAELELEVDRILKHLNLEA